VSLYLSDIGIVIEGAKGMEAVGFLYETNSCRCFADYCIVNPALTKAQRNRAISALMDALIGTAMARKFKVMEINVITPMLIKRCKERGFIDLADVKYMARSLSYGQ
jgi:hypothetical protein